MPDAGREASPCVVCGALTDRPFCAACMAQANRDADAYEAGRGTTPEHGHVWADPCTEACPAHDPHEFADDVLDDADLGADAGLPAPGRGMTPRERYEALPLCPAGCGCRVGSDDPDGSECGCDGPCTTWQGSITPSVWEDDDA